MCSPHNVTKLGFFCFCVIFLHNYWEKVLQRVELCSVQYYTVNPILTFPVIKIDVKQVLRPKVYRTFSTAFGRMSELEPVMLRSQLSVIFLIKNASKNLNSELGLSPALTWGLF